MLQAGAEVALPMRPLRLLRFLIGRRGPDEPGARASKVCTKCRRSLPPEAFFRDKSQRDGLRPDCKECFSAVSHRWQRAHPKEHHESVQRWQRAHPVETRKWEQRWRESNPERARQKAREANRIRRGRLASVIREPYSRAEVLASSGGVCPVCGLESVLEIGHVVSVALGGPDVRANVMPICSTCNAVAGTTIISPAAIPSIRARSLELQALDMRRAA